MPTDAQAFVCALPSHGRPNHGTIVDAGGRFLHRFQENRFYVMPDGSRIALSDWSGGRVLIRAMPAMDA